MGSQHKPATDVSELDDRWALQFQRREWRWQNLGRVALGLFLLTAILGGFGAGGPLARAEVTEGDLVIAYPRVVRRGAPEQLDIHRRAAAGSQAPLVIVLSQTWLSSARIDRITPAPQSERTTADGLELRFEGAEDVSVVFSVTTIGRVSYTLWIDRRSIALSQFAVF